MKLHYLLLIPLFISTSVYAQAGTDCETDYDCNPHQTCHYGYCQCDLGYVKNIHYCFKIREHGEECQFIAQCQDFRMMCEARGGDVIKRCVCDSYHQWDSSLDQCVQAANFTDMIKELKEETTWAEDIQRESKKTFFAVVVAGLSILGLGLILASLCTIYGCCCRGKRPAPSDDTEKLRVQEVASNDAPEGTYIAIPAASGITSLMPIS